MRQPNLLCDSPIAHDLQVVYFLAVSKQSIIPNIVGGTEASPQGLLGKPSRLPYGGDLAGAKVGRTNYLVFLDLPSSSSRFRGRREVHFLS
jgi:hypothetical protein